MDILVIDSKIRKTLAKTYDKSFIETRKERISRIENILTQYNIDEKERETLRNQIEVYKEEINNYIYNEKISFYIRDTSKLLDQYKSLLQRTISVPFMKVQKTQDTNNIKRDKKLISREFLKVAKNYIDLEEISDITEDTQTCSCGGEDFNVMDDHVRICTQCGEQQDIFGKVSTYKDVDRVNTSSKYTYDRRTHFRDTIYQYQGKRPGPIPQEVYTKLTERLELYGLLSTSDVQCERFKRITKEHIYMFLRGCGFKKYYDDVTFIWAELTGKTPPNISHIEDELLEEHEKMLEVYETLDTSMFRDSSDTTCFLPFACLGDRKSFLNAKYILYQLLLRRGIKCNRHDFNVLKTTDRLHYHNRVCKKIFDILEWTFTEII